MCVFISPLPSHCPAAFKKTCISVVHVCVYLSSPLSMSCSLQEDLEIQEPPEQLHAAIIEDIDHDVDIIRKASAATLAQVLEKHQSYVSVVLAQLLDLYEQRLVVSGLGF